MTSTTIIDTRVRRPALDAQPVRLPRLKTFIGQAVASAVFSHFLTFVLACAMTTENIGFWLAALPCFLFLSLFGSVPAGFIIWACTRSDAQPLRPAYRCLIALLVLSPGWLYLSWIAFMATASAQLWMVAWLFLTAIAIGLLTHSRLRVGRELVRGGAALKRTSRVLAGFSGVVLRLFVVLLFMESMVAVICLSKATDQAELIWAVLLCGHFTASLFVVFLRTDIAVLTALSVIALAPAIVLFLKFPGMTETLRYIFIGYFGLWAVFLQTRWRQTDDALAFLNEEIHYYLID